MVVYLGTVSNHALSFDTFWGWGVGKRGLFLLPQIHRTFPRKCCLCSTFHSGYNAEEGVRKSGSYSKLQHFWICAVGTNT